MSTRETAGVRAVARVLARIAEGRPMKVSELIEAEDIARSTAFEVVRHLEGAAFVRRDAGGHIRVGSAAAQVGYAAFGLAELLGPAEAVLDWLCDQTGATARLCHGHGEAEVVIQSAVTSIAARSPSSRKTALTEPIVDAAGAERASLTLEMHRSLTLADQRLAASHLHRARLTLEQFLTAGEQ